jgi:hypothetical protein
MWARYFTPMACAQNLPRVAAVCTGTPAATQEDTMAGKSVKNKSKYRALKRKGMSKTRAAKISNAGKSASRKGGRKGGKARRK